LTGSTSAFVFDFGRVGATEGFANVVRCLFVKAGLETFHFANFSLFGFRKVAIVVVFLSFVIIIAFLIIGMAFFGVFNVRVVCCTIIIDIFSIAIILIIAVLVTDLGSDVFGIFRFHLRFVLRDIACDRLNITSYLVGWMSQWAMVLSEGSSSFSPLTNCLLSLG